jgi:hypothetical protein
MFRDAVRRHMGKEPSEKSARASKSGQHMMASRRCDFAKISSSLSTPQDRLASIH